MGRSAASHLAYTLVQLDPPRDMRSAAQAVCAECDFKQKIPIVAMGNNPEKIGQMFVRQGWDFDPFHASKCLCPKCVRQRKVRRQDEIKKAEALSGHVRVLPTVTPPAPKHFDPPLVAGTRKPQTPQSLKDLTREQRALIREELEKNFDDGTGRYAKGVNDQIIADALDIPRILVEQFRDNFFGPLAAEDPVIKALRDDLESVMKGISALQTKAAQLATKLEEVIKAKENE